MKNTLATLQEKFYKGASPMPPITKPLVLYSVLCPEERLAWGLCIAAFFDFLKTSPGHIELSFAVDEAMPCVSHFRSFF